MFRQWKSVTEKQSKVDNERAFYGSEPLQKSFECDNVGNSVLLEGAIKKKC